MAKPWARVVKELMGSGGEALPSRAGFRQWLWPNHASVTRSEAGGCAEGVAVMESPPARHPWHGDSGTARTEGQQGPACAGCWQRGDRRPCDALSMSAPASQVSRAAWPRQQRQPELGRRGREGSPSAGAGGDAVTHGILRSPSHFLQHRGPWGCWAILGSLPGLCTRGNGARDALGHTCGVAAPPSHRQPCLPMGSAPAAPGAGLGSAASSLLPKPLSEVGSKLLRLRPRLRAGTQNMALGLHLLPLGSSLSSWSLIPRSRCHSAQLAATASPVAPSLCLSQGCSGSAPRLPKPSYPGCRPKNGAGAQ